MWCCGCRAADDCPWSSRRVLALIMSSAQHHGKAFPLTLSTLQHAPSIRQIQIAVSRHEVIVVDCAPCQVWQRETGWGTYCSRRRACACL